MAKHNDMPELNSAKVFSTNCFTKEHLKHYPHGFHQHLISADARTRPLHCPFKHNSKALCSPLIKYLTSTARNQLKNQQLIPVEI